MDVWPAAPPRRGIVFSPTRSYTGAKAFSVPCGQCMACRLSRAQDWSTRLAHEASRHDFNAFLTLTFADDHLPSDWSVRVRDVQLFMKRLRKSLGDKPVRFFACGEYGDRYLRPHYHLVLFGHDFPDKTPWRRSSSGFVLYRSAHLEKLWPYGLSEIGSVTTQSAGYVARYVTKKQTGPAAADTYFRVHPTTGFPWSVRPEFVCMSTRPGIGSDWYQEFNADCFPSDFVIVDGQKKPIPRYYAKKLEASSPRAHLAVKADRKEAAAQHTDEQTTRRLLTKRDSQDLRAARLTRTMDNDT